jgi:hypothetical protein
LLEQRFGDVSEDHLATRADAIDRFDADQPIAGSDVEQRRAVERLGVLEQTVANFGEAVEGDLSLALIAGVSAFEHPSRPTIGGRCHAVSIATGCGHRRHSGLAALALQRGALWDRPGVFLSFCT